MKCVIVRRIDGPSRKRASEMTHEDHLVNLLEYLSPPDDWEWGNGADASRMIRSARASLSRDARAELDRRHAKNVQEGRSR